MKSINLSVDVGGTNTRLKVEITKNGKIDFSSLTKAKNLYFLIEAFFISKLFQTHCGSTSNWKITDFNFAFVFVAISALLTMLFTSRRFALRGIFSIVCFM